MWPCSPTAQLLLPLQLLQLQPAHQAARQGPGRGHAREPEGSPTPWDGRQDQHGQIGMMLLLLMVMMVAAVALMIVHLPAWIAWR